MYFNFSIQVFTPDAFFCSKCYDDDGRLKRTGTLWTASAHIITAVIGSGVLSLAWATAQLGWIAGPTILFLFSFVTYSPLVFWQHVTTPATRTTGRGTTLTWMLSEPIWFLGLSSQLNLYEIRCIRTPPKPTFSEAMESCPKKDIPNFKKLLEEENFYLITEDGDQGRLPVLILKLKNTGEKRRPAIVFLHSTNKCKEWLRPLLEAYASRDYIAVAIDSRYHGERARSLTTYRDALVSSWKNATTMPFIFDTAWDLIKLADYLSQRDDVDHSRIGITGESLGGMHAWFAAAADTRYAVVVPIIGVQGFRWAIEHDMWKGRVDNIKAVFEEARLDLGKTSIDKDVVEKVWNRIAPGLDSCFDSPHTIPAIAPRPLLILNGEKDPRCPIGGLEQPVSKAREFYNKVNSLGAFKVDKLKVLSKSLVSSASKAERRISDSRQWC
ncbi:uncharacterized protein [Henckelia pumila]|uniref:uncharacterized protein isoform X2 n=1 Tax=Henckelia pumila TaxID=405737 RepID=UPI003C6E9F5C